MKSLLALLLALFLPAAVAASNYEHVVSFKEIEQIVAREIAEHGAQNVLVVFDTDDTLLTSQNDLGGVSWFDWQSDLLQKDKMSRDLVAQDFTGLLQAQLLLFEQQEMELTSQQIPGLLQSWSQAGVGLLIETARGAEMQPVTELQLRNNQLRHQDFPELSFYSILTPDGKRMRSYSFSNECSDIDVSRLTFVNGVFYVTGQDKGLALSCLAKQAGLSFKSVIFVDDKFSNVEQMCQHLPKQRYTELNCVHYAKMEPKQRRFLQSKALQQQASEQWAKLKLQARLQ